MTRNGEPKKRLYRCSATEMRHGYYTVRCVLSKEHEGQHINHGQFFHVTPEEMDFILAENEKPVCGKVWTPAEPLEGVEARAGHWDEGEGAWVPLSDDLRRSHVCYKAQHDDGMHKCWCGAAALQMVAQPERETAPRRQTMLRGAV